MEINHENGILAKNAPHFVYFGLMAEGRGALAAKQLGKSK